MDFLDNMNSTMKLVIALLALMVDTCLSVSERCPTTPINPCTCETYLNGACIVTCSLASQADLERLADVPDLCGGHVHLVLVHSKVEGIPARLWGQLLSSATVDVTVQHSALQQGLVPEGEVVPRTATSGEAILKIDHSSVGKWDWSHLANMYTDGELTIVIDDTPLEALEADFSEIARGKVHKININSAGLSSMGQDQFASFDYLNSLSLQNNKLTSVSRSMIAKPAKNLQFLHLNGNWLTSLPSDLFTDMPNLEIVYLRDNRLSSLPQQLLQTISAPKLLRIDLVNNPWECDCNLLSILKNTKLYLNMGVCVSPDNLAQKKIRNLSQLLDC